MRLNLNVKEDEQLRKEVRQIVKGQVVKIVRDQIKEIIAEVLSVNNENKLTANHLTQIAQQEVTSHVSKIVNEETYTNDREKLKKMVRVEVQNYLKDLDSYIKTQIEKQAGQYVREETSAFVEREVSDQVKNRIAKMLS